MEVKLYGHSVRIDFKYMNVNIHPSWSTVLQEEFDKPYFKQLIHFVRHAYKTQQCYPPGEKIFSAFDYCPFDSLKVIILGQDPYHGANQANGLCFSVNKSITHPPSLVNIFKEVAQNTGKTYQKNGDLKHWSNQGVLLLNATLSVQEGIAGSHQNQGWEIFTDRVITTISQLKENIVFMLWGNYAKQKQHLININKHLILTSGHPSPLSANRGLWFGNQHFKLCNDFLKRVHLKKIDW